VAINFLEQLVAKWYEYQGYFVRRNVFVGKRTKGGFECELDVVAFHPETKHLVQIEPSSDANSWVEREKRYKKKFDAGKKYIHKLFKGLDLPEEIEQIALFIYGSKNLHKTISGGKIILISELLNQINQELKIITEHAIPEQYVILRSFQFFANFIK
jgi:hypothetical protein